ncbi:MAG: response regulator transcription factor [Solirubrobacterales bacterium]|nr:response regulator transcription factor [Solirubrobacterales bacterium]
MIRSRFVGEAARTSRVLVIEGALDGDSAAAVLRQRDDITCLLAPDSEGALRMFYSEQPDAVVLDLEVPGEGGWEPLASIREMSALPVLVISPEHGPVEAAKGLNSGADDCMAKPVDEEELTARIDALLRRSSSEGEATMVVADEFVCIATGFSESGGLAPSIGPRWGRFRPGRWRSSANEHSTSRPGTVSSSPRCRARSA